MTLKKTPEYQRRSAIKYEKKLRDAGYIRYQKHVKPEHKKALDELLEEMKNFDGLPEVAKQQHLYQKGFIDKIAEIGLRYIKC